MEPDNPAASPATYKPLIDVSKFLLVSIFEDLNFTSGAYSSVEPPFIPGITLSKSSKPSNIFNTILCGRPIDISPGTTSLRDGSTKDFSNLDHVLLLPSLRSYKV